MPGHDPQAKGGSAGADSPSEEAVAAARAAAEEEAKSLKGELQRVSEALEACEASSTETETLLAETKQVCACARGGRLYTG